MKSHIAGSSLTSKASLEDAIKHGEMQELKEAGIDKTSAEWEGIVDKYLAMIKKEIIGGDT